MINADGEAINIEYQGLVKLDESIGMVLGAMEGAKTTAWGGAVVGVRFEVSVFMVLFRMGVEDEKGGKRGK